MTKDINRLLREARLAGWRIERHSRGGHFKCYPPDRSLGFVTVSGSPSDYRGVKNVRREFRRRGLTV